MVKGVIYKNEDIIFTVFKKHYCPDCGTRLKRFKVSRIVNSNSPEAENYDFRIGTPAKHMVGDVKFVWTEFKCPNCSRQISIDDMEKIENS